MQTRFPISPTYTKEIPFSSSTAMAFICANPTLTCSRLDTHAPRGICMRSGKRRSSSAGQNGRSQRRASGSAGETRKSSAQNTSSAMEKIPPISPPLAPPVDEEDLLIESEARLRLPDAPVSVTGNRVRRRRRKQRDGDAIAEFGSDKEQSEASKSASSDKEEVDDEYDREIRKLTSEFQEDDNELNKFMKREIEKDPDYLFQTREGGREYDLAAALIGVGKPNKQGIYTLPYLQSGHILLLLIVLLGAFVYYPGFPLTELDEGVANTLKRGLALTFAVNAVLSWFAFTEAKKHAQPPLLWMMKTALLGGIALSELRGNTGNDVSKSSSRRKSKRR